MTDHCEICEQSGQQNMATTSRYTEHAFGNTESRNVYLCGICAAKIDEDNAIDRDY